MTLVVALVIAGGCVNRENQAQAKRTENLLKDPVVPIRASTVETRQMTESLEISGETVTSDDATVGSKIGGRLVAVYVQDGDSVSAGQTLATLDTASLNIQMQQAMAQVAAAQSAVNQARQNAVAGPQKSTAQLETAKAQLRSAKAQLQKAQNGSRPEEKRQAENAVAAARSNMDTAKKQADRARELWAAGAISKQQLEVAENAYQSALAQYQSSLESLNMAKNWSRPEDISTAQEAVRQAEEAVRSAEVQKKLDSLLTEQVQAARANLLAAQSQVNLVRQQISDASIKAPFSGRISGKPSQPGTVVSPGSPIARIVGAQGIYFEGEVPATSIATINLGSRVTITVESLSSREFSGKVAAISPSATNIGRLYKVRVQFDAAPAELRPGMFASGRVALRTLNSVVAVPSVAIVRRAGIDYVFLVEGDKAKQVKVTKGLEQDGWTQVQGIGAGSTLVIQGQASLEEGTKVKIESGEAKSASTGA